ncbi:hypothetical protein EJ06DRAFT_374081 [Trichodelitschia bisporula]|uniref:Transcription factor domain-containing protein n=1 Tax=Trichodelitschia bisporula TaxID=703511 RepID=A0A6G1I288_9PEZI|nr:hypothetical protein EJ06DRAFT_374081 [Trichodelitschia bisporula]
MFDHEVKDIKVYQVLTAALPRGDELKAALQRSNHTWSTSPWLHGVQTESLETFSQKAFSHSSPHDVAQVALAIAATADDASLLRLLGVVDRYIIADDEYLNSLDGIQCAVKQCTLYTKTGNIVRSSHIWRRAIAAQMISLHRTRHSPHSDMLWWQLYTIDRFGNMILNTPYTIADAHCNLDFKQIQGPPLVFDFILRLCQLAGKVIDYLQTRTSELQSLSNKMTQLASSMPASFWGQGPETAMENRRRVGNLLVHMGFYQVDLSLHMPSMLRPRASGHAPRGHALARCIVPARKILLIAKRLDFSPLDPGFRGGFSETGLSAAVVLCLALQGYGGFEYAAVEGGDWGLLDGTVRAYEEKGWTEGWRVSKGLVEMGDTGAGEDLVFSLPFYGKFAVTPADFLPRAGESIVADVDSTPMESWLSV